MFASGFELRDGDGTGGLRLTGYASVYGRPYQVGSERSGFVEVIKHGAAKRTLSESPHVVLNVQHGDALSGLPIARTKSGTLRLSEDEIGLRVEADLDPEDDDVRALKRKWVEVTSTGAMSFAFKVTSDSFSADGSHREIQAFSLHQGDCSLVVNPANAATSSELVARALATTSPRVPDLSIATQRDRERLACIRLDVPLRPARAHNTVRSADYYTVRLKELRSR